MNRCLFEVVGKATGEIFPVFSVRADKNGYPQFLVFIRGRWEYFSAKIFKPLPKEGE